VILVSGRGVGVSLGQQERIALGAGAHQGLHHLFDHAAPPSPGPAALCLRCCARR
jgi:hypothetical protein